MSLPRYVHGTKEYVSVPVTSDVSLTTQGVSIKFAGQTFAAGWIGSAGTTRTARTSSPVDFSAIDPGVYQVWPLVDDTPEDPLLDAGFLWVSDGPA